MQRTSAGPTAREGSSPPAPGRRRPTGADLLVAEHAGANDADCAALWTQISERRAANMLRFAPDLRGTGEIRADLSDNDVADVIGTMNAAEYFDLLGRRGWPPERIGHWLADAWTRLPLT